MKLPRFLFSFLSILIICAATPVHSHPVLQGWGMNALSFLVTNDAIVKAPIDGGIREDVPDKYRARFEKWKAELRSTDFGRRQWDTYADNKLFLLTIKVSASRGKGAGTDQFLWTEDGKFVGATITLGAELDEGYPPPTYYGSGR